ncbi:periplasmic heavy metal sensor [Marinicauda algicola]|uniref:Periplasmic heavy metal sensor n=1 Tax=Marinicauda algicola TaxID=2029849 RepID=A0A4V3RXX6_9PROT|nr:periplasmic heavy metal sensor [Marinicauda algicola]TGY88199.1 periplasmic heavy metal sensor [Marinicauda algicola]
MIRSGLLAAILGLAGGLLGVWIGIGLGSEAPAGESFHVLIHDELDLDPDQEARIEEIEARFASLRRAKETELAEAREAIGEALLRDKALSEDVMAATARYHDAMLALQLATLDHILEMRAELGPDQAAEFDSLLARAFDDQG